MRAPVQSFEPRTGEPAASLEGTTRAELDAKVARATSAAPTLATTPPATRRRWLRGLADVLEHQSAELVRMADRETALGSERLRGELARTAGQLRFYADVAAEGSFLGATVDHLPTGVLARVGQPLGPVAVFGASNFPFAFSVLGNDTASALAAGCPVLVKAHDAHAGLSSRLGSLAEAHLSACGAPEGTFALVAGFDAGVELVRASGVAAVGFTGSQAGGMALWQTSQQREVPVPVFAEMGTVNPVVVTRSGGTDMATAATGFVQSFTLGSGQYCTKPGLMLAPRGVGAPAAVADALTAAAPDPLMLTGAIAQALRTGIADLEAAGAHLVTTVDGTAAGWSGRAAVLTAPLDALRPGSRLLEECFGPVVVVVEYDDIEDVHAALGRLQGALAASIITGGDQDCDVAPLVARLAQKVGRVCVDDWPTGVAYTWAQHHGGPWPATTDPTVTSVGAAALQRWVRPVAYQGVPDACLPAPVQEGNPWGISRRVDGRLEPAG